MLLLIDRCSIPHCSSRRRTILSLLCGTGGWTTRPFRISGNSAVNSTGSPSDACYGRSILPFLFSKLTCQVIQAMFPHIPPSSIAHDLSRTGSVEITTNNILTRNSLPPVISTKIFSWLKAPRNSPYHQQFPFTQAPASSSSSAPSASKPDLISRYNLEPRLSEDLPQEPVLQPNDKGKGKASSLWGQSPSDREDNFKKRRDDMILRARRQMQEQGKEQS